MYTTWKKNWGYIGIILTVCLSVCPLVLICPSFCAIVSNRYLSYEEIKHWKILLYIKNAHDLQVYYNFDTRSIENKTKNIFQIKAIISFEGINTFLK